MPVLSASDARLLIDRLGPDASTFEPVAQLFWSPQLVHWLLRRRLGPCLCSYEPSQHVWTNCGMQIHPGCAW